MNQGDELITRHDVVHQTPKPPKESHVSQRTRSKDTKGPITRSQDNAAKDSYVRGILKTTTIHEFINHKR